MRKAPETKVKGCGCGDEGWRRTTAALGSEIRKAPDIAEADGVGDEGEDELNRTIPFVALRFLDEEGKLEFLKRKR